MTRTCNPKQHGSIVVVRPGALGRDRTADLGVTAEVAFPLTAGMPPWAEVAGLPVVAESTLMPPQAVGPEATDPSAAGALATGAAEGTQAR